ncbi:alpha/beta hydrolase [Microbacteriaceae bacterium VKM Ac-2855]|nr:alpha/beta hydrolase [Microbacteriaceae bacterium VKM Ac-2855]
MTHEPRPDADGRHWGDLEEGPIHPAIDDRTPEQRSHDEADARRWRESIAARTTRIAFRTRVLGWVMRHSRSMHISTMTAKDIAHNQTMSYLPRFVLRWVFGARHPETQARDLRIDGPGGPLRLRLYRPRRSAATLPVAVYFHGGGWTLFGGLDACDWLPSRVAALAGIAVVAVDYRLAPEHPYPAAVEDALAAVHWVDAHHDELGTDARLAVFGDSAGGNLSAVVALALRDAARTEPGMPRLAAQGLIYPVTSTTLDDAAMIENAQNPVLFRADMAEFLRHYLGGDAGIAARSSDPLAAPLAAATLAGLPPALVQIADHDVLRDQGIAYAERLRDDHVPTSVERYPSAAHGWVTYPRLARASRPAAESMARFLRQRLRP